MKKICLMGMLLSGWVLGGYLCAEESPKLTVTGQAELRKAPDTFSLALGIVSLDQNVKKALQINNEKMENLLSALKKLGLREDEVQTGQFTILPQFTPAPKDAPSDWTPSIAGYEARNMVYIHTNKLELMDSLVNAAAEAGGNIFQDIHFSLQEEQKARKEALTAAIEQAQSYAAAASKAAGVQLEEIMDLSINQPYVNHRSLKVAAAALQDGSSSFAPGNIEISASVSITYKIRTR